MQGPDPGQIELARGEVGGWGGRYTGTVGGWESRGARKGCIGRGGSGA